MKRNTKWLIIAGVAQVVIAPLMLLAAQLVPSDDESRFLVFFPEKYSGTHRMNAVLNAGALPLSVGWHGGWIVETEWEHALDQLKSNGAYLVLSGEGLAACGAEEPLPVVFQSTPYSGE